MKCKHCRQPYELEVRHGCGGASGCLGVVVLLVAGVICANILTDKKVANRPAPARAPSVPKPELVAVDSSPDPAPAPATETTEQPLKTVPVASPTSYAKLRQFSNETDELLKELDKAIAIGLVQNDSAWGDFARDFNKKAEAFKRRSQSIEPMRARIIVGSVAGYVQTLLTNRGDRKYREYVSSVIEERDEYLEGIRRDLPAANSTTAESAIGDNEQGPEFHNWTSGKYSVEAAFLSFTNDHVKIRKRDGSTADVPVDRLSDESKELLKSILRTKAKRSFDF
ncbi:SHD1 domain-containing protein [Stieleria sp. TO1_6]|uniref:SHD1 domain-containing protein n=1 Tax=Stieleria tagensis TaxID=2956795 RepID=UPI00209B9D68|nr:SHD1 domain-containing protein [Stieleria tagensis]MCO8124259.1 SHD1 domain-containing protein [Stieleria tagensis]